MWRKNRRWIAYSLVVIWLGLAFILLQPPTINEQKATRSVVSIEAKVKKKMTIFDLFFLSNPKTKGKDSKDIPKSLPDIIVTNGGTGFSIEHGRILTCYHVVKDAVSVTVTTNNVTQEAKIVRVSKETDLAELSVQNPPPSLRLGSRVPSVGDKLWQIGNPGPLAFVVTTGLFLTFDYENNNNTAILDTYFGNSGSPVMNRRGEVIGMTHTIIQGTRFTGIGTLQELTNFLHPSTPR